jgi:hypothetical protein
MKFQYMVHAARDSMRKGDAAVRLQMLAALL